MKRDAPMADAADPGEPWSDDFLQSTLVRRSRRGGRRMVFLANDPDDILWDAPRLSAVHAQPDKSRRVRRMFDAIAPTYELINSLFSAGRDRSWRRRAVQLAGVRPGDGVLDVACGTGDFVRAFASGASDSRRLVGVDFSHRMLLRAVRRPTRRGTGAAPPTATWCEGDALALPVADRAFDVVSCAFGVRNFQDLDRGLREMHRVLRHGGRAVIIEFTRPSHRIVRAIHEFYCRYVMPLGAALLSGDRTGAYRYLPRSVVSFCGPQELRDRLLQAGFATAQATPLTFGVVTVYVATKEDA